MVGRSSPIPALGAAILALLLTQSRGALVAAVIGAIAWLALVPLRLRIAAPDPPALAGAGAVGAWALSKDAFSVAAEPLRGQGERRRRVRPAAVLMFARPARGRRARERRPDPRAPLRRARRRMGIAALVVACAVPLAAFTSAASAGRSATASTSSPARRTPPRG